MDEVEFKKAVEFVCKIPKTDKDKFRYSFYVVGHKFGVLKY